MLYNIHQKFITTPILDILKGTVTACKAIGYGIETQPLCEYIMQTTFLKMTGASEQKLKCIRWEMATYDYEYRYEIQSKALGECSNYKSKNSIFKEMQNVIKKIDTYNRLNGLFDATTKGTIVDRVKKDFASIVEKSSLSIWRHRDWMSFEKFYDSNKLIESFPDFENGACDLFNNNNNNKDNNNKDNNNKNNKDKNNKDNNKNYLKELYENLVYRHRNRCAHNLKSYQHNLPTFDTLASKKYEDEKNENYFKMFFILILMDELYMKLYCLYLECLEKNLSL